MSSLKEIKQTAHHSETLVFRDSYCSCTFQDWFNCKCILSPPLFLLPSTPSYPSIIFPSLRPSLPVHPLPCILHISPLFPSLLLFHSSLSFHWRSLGELVFSFPSAHVSKLALYNQLQFCLEGCLERLSNIYHNALFMNRWVHCTLHHSLYLTPHHTPHYTTPHHTNHTSPHLTHHPTTLHLTLPLTPHSAP